MKPDLIVCSGFMPVFARARRDRAMLFMTLFQPSAYDPEHLKMIAHDIDVWASDSQWSHRVLSKVLCGASGVVRSIVVSRLPVDAPSDAGTFRIAVGGTLQPRKGQLYAIKALKLLLDRGIDAILNIYGYSVPALQWYRDDLKAAITSLNLGEKVVIHDFKDLDAIASANDIILSSSTDESLPQTVAECMARGVIPVAVLSGGIDELITDGANGFITIDHAPENITSALERAIHNRAHWGEMRNASALLLSEYSVEKARSSLIELLERGQEKAQTRKSLAANIPQWTLAPTTVEYWRARVARLERLKQTLKITNSAVSDP